MDLIKVASDSRSTAVAGAIAGVMREQDTVDVQAIGAGAVNQAIKAVAIARGYLELDGIDIVCIPSFVEVEIEGHERTAVRLSIEKRGDRVLQEEEREEEREPPSEPGSRDSGPTDW